MDFRVPVPCNPYVKDTIDIYIETLHTNVPYICCREKVRLDQPRRGHTQDADTCAARFSPQPAVQKQSKQYRNPIQS